MTQFIQIYTGTIFVTHMYKYLVIPWLVRQHFNTLKSRCFTLPCEYSSFRKQVHVYTLAKVNDCQAMRRAINVTRVIIQKPACWKGGWVLPKGVMQQAFYLFF